MYTLTRTSKITWQMRDWIGDSYGNKNAVGDKSMYSGVVTRNIFSLRWMCGTVRM